MPEPFLTVDIHASESRKNANSRLFVHEDLAHWTVQNTDGSIRVRLKKRNAYPVTFCRQVGATFVLGYGVAQHKNEREEYLRITLHADGRIQIIRDAFATLPLFYAANGKRCTLSNEYAYVVNAVDRPTLNTLGIVEHLAMNTRVAPPLVREVRYLEERDVFEYKPFSPPLIHKAKDRAWTFSSEAHPTNPNDFLPVLTSHLEHFTQTRLSGQAFAFQVSGGLDSATLPQYFTRKYGQLALMTTMLLTDHYAAAQKAKLDALTSGRSNGMVATVLDPNQHFPLARMITPGKYYPHYGEHIYSEAMTPAADALQAQGVKVLCTGEGGDELFLNITPQLPGFMSYHNEHAMRSARKLAPFVTQKFRQEYIANAAASNGPIPHRHHNAGYAQLSNNLYIRRDIWPVSPFFDPQLYAFCQGLPAHFRANKNILRAFHQAMAFEPAIYNDVQNEYFDAFMQACLEKGGYNALMAQLLERSVTIQKGYVDRNALVRAFSAKMSEELIFQFNLFFSVEINAQYTAGF